MKTTLTLIATLFAFMNLSIGQMQYCEDFGSLNNQISFSIGDTIQTYTENNLEVITIDQTGVSTISNGLGSGIYLSGGTITHHLNVQNNSKLYSFYSSDINSGQHTITLNGNFSFSLDTIFPIINSNYHIEFTTVIANSGNQEFGYLTIHGNVSTVELVSNDLGFYGYCNALDYIMADCEDFTNVQTVNSQYFMAGDTILNNSLNENVQSIIALGAVDGNTMSNSPGIYAIDSEVEVNLLTYVLESNIYFYGFYSQYGDSYVMINDSNLQIPLDTVFPLQVAGGIILDLDTSIINFGNWERAKLSIYGFHNKVVFHGFEAGLTIWCSYAFGDYVNTENIDKETIKVFPNPTTGILKIKGLTNDATLVLYNSQGQELIYSTKNQLDLTEYDEGIYFLHILKEDGTNVVKRVLKL